MNEVEFYRGPRRDRPISRSLSERYDKIRRTESPRDYGNERNNYSFYTGSNYNNARITDDDTGKGMQSMNVNSKSHDSGTLSDGGKTLDSTGKQKSFRNLCTRFAGKTSMQGVAYINSAKFWWARLIWCLMLLVAIVAMSAHLWYLIDQYTDYPVQTKISLGFETLKFPQITICNTNTIHKGRLDKYNNAEKLKELLESLHPENLVPDQFNPNYDPFAKKTQPSGGQQGGGDKGQSSNPGGGSSSSGGQQGGGKPVSRIPRSRNKRFLDKYKELNKTNFGGKDHPDFRNILPKDKNDYDGEVDSRTALEDLFRWLFMEIPKNERASLGHNITDMLIRCTFNGLVCSPGMFSLHQTSEYGNCWTITTDKLKVKHSGPSGGLSMVFYLESSEYLKGLTTGYGIRIQIQEPLTYPFPADEGMFIPASMETDIGLRMVSITRERGVYGDCDDGKDLEENTKYKYTRSVCQMLCLTNKIIEACHCYDERLEELATSRDTGHKQCRNTTEIVCMEKIKKGFIKKDISCTCSNSCNEVLYVKSVSQRQWPDDHYAMVLLQTICNKDPDVCSSLRQFLSSPTKINNNFLKLNIYYEDLNYENLTEVPEIQIQQFLSDVGGAIGLWIGLSILSLCEVIQLFVELCDYGIYKVNKETKKGRRQRRKARRTNLALAADDGAISKDENNWPKKRLSNDPDNSRPDYNLTQGQQSDRPREY